MEKLWTFQISKLLPLQLPETGLAHLLLLLPHRLHPRNLPPLSILALIAAPSAVKTQSRSALR
jgi:hypothetical protein